MIRIAIRLVLPRRSADTRPVPPLKPGPAVKFEPVTLSMEDIQPVAEFIVMAIEAGRTILLDDSDFRAYAAEHKLSVVALTDRGILEAAA